MFAFVGLPIRTVMKPWIYFFNRKEHFFLLNKSHHDLLVVFSPFCSFVLSHAETVHCSEASSIINYGLIYFQISIENDYLGPRRIESLQKEDADWQRKAHMAVLSIQDLTVKYFEITAKAQKGSYFLLSYTWNKRSWKVNVYHVLYCIMWLLFFLINSVWEFS